MNNLTYGNARYQNYETICSGSPAGKMNSGAGSPARRACTRT
jgi:5-oxoprolinase (ATP-hydrolysing)